MCHSSQAKPTFIISPILSESGIIRGLAGCSGVGSLTVVVVKLLPEVVISEDVTRAVVSTSKVIHMAVPKKLVPHHMGHSIGLLVS